MDIKVLKEFTPIPFWFWNDYLTEEEILRQMKEMKDKGVEGFVIHPRKGLPKKIEYLSEEYFHFVRYAVSKAKEMDMKVVLYDEAMYPSGSCHGAVVRSNPDFASKGLMKCSKEEDPAGTLVASCDDAGYVMVPSHGTIRGVHPGEDDGEENAPASADLLNPGAVAAFIELTHEVYYRELKEYFGDTIIGFFTDEPNILGRNSAEGIIPWSEGILEEFLAEGAGIEDLKYLFENSQEKSDDNASDTVEGKKALAIYKKVIYKRLSESYYRQLSDWCSAHDIALTGHPEKSTDIGYLKFFHIPCQDIVWRFVEPEDGHAIEGEHSTMGKCSSDSARHRGKRRNGNECFGCCGERQDPYLFTEEDMRWYLNWLFVRGVNLVYPHAFYYSVRDGRGDERPPEVGLGNPFWPEYRRMSDFIKRMCYLNTDAVNQTNLAILCSEDELSWQLAKPLFTNQIEFNYLERALLEKCSVREGKLFIEKQEYNTLIIDKKDAAELEMLQKGIIDNFRSGGGKVIIADGLSVGESEDEALGYLAEVERAVARDIVFSGDIYDLRFTHLKKEEDDYMILSNEGETKIVFTCELGNGYRAHKVLNPYTCEEREYPGVERFDMKIGPGDLWVVELDGK